MNGRKIALLVIFLVIISILAIRIRSKEIREVGTDDYSFKVGELHSVEGIENAWRIETETRLEVEYYRRIKIPLLNWTTKWGTRHMQAPTWFGGGVGAPSNEEGKWDLYGHIKYYYGKKKVLGIIQIQYVAPKFLGDVNKRNKRNCSICNNFENGQPIQKYELPINIYPDQESWTTTTRFKFKPNINFTKNVTIKITDHEPPKIKINDINPNKTKKYQYKKINTTNHFKN